MEKPIIKSVSNGSVGPLISMESSDSTNIYYTLDGSNPSKDNGILYTKEINYPVNTTIKAIASNDNENSDITEYVCTIPFNQNQWDFIFNSHKYVSIKKDFDLLSYSMELNNDYIDITYGKLRNFGAYSTINSFILPFGFDFDDKFINCPITFDKLKWKKKGQILQQNGWLKIFDGANWHDFLQIYSGTFANKPTVEQGIPVGFSYFCTDKQTTEGATNGIMIYYKGDGVWVDTLGRVVDNNYPTNIKGTTEERPTLTSTDEGFEYYDSTLKKKILWNGTEWTNLDGTALT